MTKKIIENNEDKTSKVLKQKKKSIRKRKNLGREKENDQRLELSKMREREKG